MSTNIPPLRNFKNFAKCMLFYYRTGWYVLTEAILWLTGGEDELKARLATLDRSKFDSKNLEEFINGSRSISDCDLTFLYKIAQTVCDIEATQIVAPRLDASKPISQVVEKLGQNIIWTSGCPKYRRDELEYLFFKLKNGRNNIAHPGVEVKNMADWDLEERHRELNELFKDILEKAGQKANISEVTVKAAQDHVVEDLERICTDEDIADSMKPYVKELILNDLKMLYEEDLEISFEKEFKGYSIPFLCEDKTKTTINMQDIFTEVNCNTQVIVVLGEAGAGKTTLTRFLFYAWLSGDNDKIVGILEFDVVLRIECNSISSRDLNQFFENHFPKAFYSFIYTKTLSRHFKEYKVLWIMDGYDESTAEFHGFLKEIKRYIPETHKLLITSRQQMLGELKACFSKTTSLTLGKLRKSNIEEIVRNYASNQEEFVRFFANYDLLEENEISFLENPLHFKMFIELWHNDPSLVKGNCTLTKLYDKSTELQLQRLTAKLQGHTSFGKLKDLQRSVENWFYGCLCKQSFLMRFKLKLKMGSEIEDLEADATRGHLIPSLCMSSFFEITYPSSIFTDCEYSFQHSTQQLFYAVLFMKVRMHQPDFDIKKLIYEGRDSTLMPHPPTDIELLDWYIQMIAEDNLVSSSPSQVFTAVQNLISLFDEYDQTLLLFRIWIAMDKNGCFMKEILQHLETMYLNFRTIIYYGETFANLQILKDILGYGHLKKLVINTEIICNRKYLDSWKIRVCMEEFLEIIEDLDCRKTLIEIIPRSQENAEQIESIEDQFLKRCYNAKHQVVCYEVVKNAVIQTLRWLYKSQDKTMEEQLIELVKDDCKHFHSRDKFILQNLAIGNCRIEDLDPTILLKITKVITELDAANDADWTKYWRTCDQEKLGLEKLINYIQKKPQICIKEENLTKVRNRADDVITNLLTAAVTHKPFIPNCKSISDSPTAVSQEEFMSLLESIFWDVGKIAEIQTPKIEEVTNHFLMNFINIFSSKNIDSFKEIHAKHIIVSDLIGQFEEHQKSHVALKMKMYSVPSLLVNDSSETISASDILKLSKSQNILVKGREGSGKSVFARFLYNSWVSGDMSQAPGLQTFDLVLFVERRRICTNNVSDFLECLLPRASSSFPTIGHLKKHLKTLNVLWIWDRFDEYIKHNISVIINVLKGLPKGHKFLITVADYDLVFNRVRLHMSDFKVFTLEPLKKQNIDEIIVKSITHEVYRLSFKAKLDSLDVPTTSALGNPYCLCSFIDLWLNNPEVNLESNNSDLGIVILILMTKLHLHRLKEHHSGSNLEDFHTDDWFYGSLCKQSLLMVFRKEINMSSSILKMLQGDAVKWNLNPVTCLSSFLEPTGSDVVGYDFIHKKQPIVLATYFLKEWRKFLPFPERKLIETRFEVTECVLNTFIYMAIDENLSNSLTFETLNKLLSDFSDEEKI